VLHYAQRHLLSLDKYEHEIFCDCFVPLIVDLPYMFISSEIFICLFLEKYISIKASGTIGCFTFGTFLTLISTAIANPQFIMSCLCKYCAAQW
jgi:hypothetical protein